MIKYLVGAIALLAIGACAPTFPAGPSGGIPEYVWVGCRTVDKNPASDGSIAFGPFGTMTSVLFFKQKNKDGSVKPTVQEEC